MEWEAIISLLLGSGFTGTIGGWFAGKKKYKQELVNATIENTRKNLSLYQSIIDDLSDRYEKSTNKLSMDLETCRKIKEVLKEEIAKLKKIEN